jgi:hypothetical protein
MIITNLVDINPPAGSYFETHYLNFPTMTALTTQDMPSAFASKTHALLCRSYTKGRDWYDFLWYVNRNIQPNLGLLTNAVEQVGPWEGLSISATPKWLIEKMRERILTIDWASAKRDVQRFLSAREQASLKLWNADFFLYHADKLENSF